MALETADTPNFGRHTASRSRNLGHLFDTYLSQQQTGKPTPYNIPNDADSFSPIFITLKLNCHFAFEMMNSHFFGFSEAHI